MNSECLQLLGARIRDLRKAQGISQDKLALMIGSSAGKAYISRIERGKCNVSILVLQRIATALDVSVKDLIEF